MIRGRRFYEMLRQTRLRFSSLAGLSAWLLIWNLSWSAIVSWDG
jgi:hypothetical protein